MNPRESSNQSKATNGTSQPEPFTWHALSGVSGASMAVTMVCGTLSAAFDWQYPKWVPLALALLVVVVADVSIRRSRRAAEFKNPRQWLLWVLNACLVFITAVGGTRLVTPAPAEAAPLVEAAPVAEPTPVAEATQAPSANQEPAVSAQPTAASGRVAVRALATSAGTTAVSVGFEPVEPAAAGTAKAAIASSAVASRAASAPPKAVPAQSHASSTSGFRRLGELSLNY
jgi:hypothetical protein